MLVMCTACLTGSLDIVTSRKQFVDTVIVYFSLVQAQYWQDPIAEAIYREKSQFLAEINQENVGNILPLS